MIALVSWSGLCHHPVEDIIQMLLQAMVGLNRKAVVPQRAEIRGKSRTCWQTVVKAVKKQGGISLPGWSVVEQEPRLPQSNPLARVVLNAHCVLERDGLWYETIPERYNHGFFPGDVPTRDTCIEFYDDYKSVKRADLPAWSFEGLPYTHLAFQLPSQDSIAPPM